MKTGWLYLGWLLLAQATALTRNTAWQDNQCRVGGSSKLVQYLSRSLQCTAYDPAGRSIAVKDTM